MFAFVTEPWRLYSLNTVPSPNSPSWGGEEYAIAISFESGLEISKNSVSSAQCFLANILAMIVLGAWKDNFVFEDVENSADNNGNNCVWTCVFLERFCKKY